MARIAGINIPNQQHAAIALTAIFGVGRSRARLICDSAGVKHTTKIKDLTDAEAGLGARDTLRLEAGMPLYGHELDEDTDPLATGFGWASRMATTSSNMISPEVAISSGANRGEVPWARMSGASTRQSSEASHNDWSCRS